MNPQEAGFDGAKGIGITSGGVFKLRRGPTPPWEEQPNFHNQLVWQTSTPPHLYYCNEDGAWFELSFHPLHPES